MYLTGFADEAADDIDGQITVTKKLGWSRIEIRAVDGKNIHDLTEEDFNRVKGRLEEAGIRANALGSNIANWGHDIDEPFDEVLNTVDRAILRMKILEADLVRIMSWKVIETRRGVLSWISGKMSAFVGSGKSPGASMMPVSLRFTKTVPHTGE